VNEHGDLGGVVVEIFKRAIGAVLICTPFVKENPLRRLLDSVDDSVSIHLFTRWRPDEVAAGVSDTSVLPIVEARGGTVHLCERLHAKLFRADGLALVGSANLTGAALGWSTNPNLELLVEVPAETPAVLALEAELAGCSIPATAALAAEVERVAALLPSRRTEFETPAASFPSPAWHPLLREPADLFVAYSKGASLLSSTSSAAAHSDLAALEIPPGLAREPFEALVANRLLQSPLVAEVDLLLAKPRRFGEVSKLLGNRLGLDHHDASHAWQTLMRWLNHFLPERYTHDVPSHSEIMRRVNEWNR
jgi:hypothetical protein